MRGRAHLRYTAMLMCEGAGKTEPFRRMQTSKTMADMRAAATAAAAHPHFTQPGGTFLPAMLEPPPDLPEVVNLAVNSWRAVPGWWRPGNVGAFQSQRKKAAKVRAAKDGCSSGKGGGGCGADAGGASAGNDGGGGGSGDGVGAAEGGCGRSDREGVASVAALVAPGTEAAESATPAAASNGAAVVTAVEQAEVAGQVAVGVSRKRSLDQPHEPDHRDEP